MLYLKKKIIIKEHIKNFNLKKYNFKNKGKINCLIKYFFILRKKRKVFKFTGVIIKNKKIFTKIRVRLNNEIFFLNFYIFNPYLIIYKIKDQKNKISYLYKKNFLNTLIEILTSQYIFKKYYFFKKTKHRFR